ncbi:lanthionine synthetase C family protein [Flavobacterium procerum]|uniref:Lanthionine synthetase C family protein n=1 Tax=Flavobacterium procerum TaxID=1455569 RepID=A0ABV6BP86_9FLAO
MTQNTNINQISITKKLNSKLLEINETLKKQYESEDLGVLTGLTGHALFHFYYSRFSNTEEPSEIGVKIIAECFEKINQNYEISTYCSGIASFGWVLEHLYLENFIDFDNDKILSDLDHYLFERQSLDSSIGLFDFLHGSIGYGYYFLARYKNTASQELKKRYKIYLLKLISSLEEFAIESENKIKWESILSMETQKRGYNFSLSHGIPSIINFLCRLHSFSDFKSSVDPLIKKSISYILDHKNTEPNHYSIFPNFECESTNKNRHSRLAWCYGDLGVGITLLQAAKTLQDKNLNKIAIDILKHSAQRVQQHDTMIKDAGICHGAFGVAKVFNRVYKETHEPIFKAATEHWLNEGLEMCSHQDGFAGYKKWVGGQEIWENELSLLEGISGIGLVIIDYLTDNEFNWDECLMIS